MHKILITGGSGLVGRRLTKLLKKNNYNVVVLSRNPKKENEFKWDVSKSYIDKKALENIDFIIHLAGAGIAEKRWTRNRKKIIIDSRVQSADLLFKEVDKQNLKGFISASGIGYYGAQTSSKIFTENDDSGNDFLSDVCFKWEKAATQFKNKNTFVTILRTGVVLSKNGGALEKMKTPIISAIGSGKQYLPWIHLDDLCKIYLYAIEKEINGIYNAVSVEHITNKDFSKKLAKVIKRPFLNFNVPAFVLKIALGELSKILLEGSRISSKKIEKSGFSFRFKNLDKALLDLF